MTRDEYRALVTELLQRLGHDPNLVRSVDIDTWGYTLTVYELDADGDKYIGDDGEPALRTERVDLPLAREGVMPT